MYKKKKKIFFLTYKVSSKIVFFLFVLNMTVLICWQFVKKLCLKNKEIN